MFLVNAALSFKDIISFIATLYKQTFTEAAAEAAAKAAAEASAEATAEGTEGREERQRNTCVESSHWEFFVQLA